MEVWNVICRTEAHAIFLPLSYVLSTFHMNSFKSSDFVVDQLFVVFGYTHTSACM
jgi:hypothetical protein